MRTVEFVKSMVIIPIGIVWIFTILFLWGHGHGTTMSER